MVRELNLRSAMAVPLVAHNRVLGVITWVAGDQGRRFDEHDLAFAEDLARRAAVAIDNAQLHTELREMAIRLQRAVLPTAMPRIEGWEVAAHYSPAGHLDAGGDFYDVIPLDGGRVAIFIGDVMGRGVDAAAAMAQMRAAIRALVAVDPEPQRGPRPAGQGLRALRDEPAGHHGLRRDRPGARRGHARQCRTPTAAAGPGRRQCRAARRCRGRAPRRRPGRAHHGHPPVLRRRRAAGLHRRPDRAPQRGHRRRSATPAGRGRASGPTTDHTTLDALVTEVSDPQRDDDVAVLVVRRKRA